MKIKKTQPSFYEYTHQHHTQNRNTYAQYPDIHIVPQNNAVQQKRPSSRSSSPRKPIFDKNTSSHETNFALQRTSQNILQQRSSRPHSLTIKQQQDYDNIAQFKDHSKFLPEENHHQIRKRSRRKIFERSMKKPSAPQTPKQGNFKIVVSPPKPHHPSNNVIPVKLNIKQLSQKIKKNHESPKNDQQILKKISHLQQIVRDIHNKVSSRSIETQNNKENKIIIIKNEQNSNVNKIQNFQQQIVADSRARSYSEMESNMVLQLQLQQMRRCERIAKQNELLYGKLVKNIQENQNELNRSIASTYRFQNIYSNRSSRSIKRRSPDQKSRQKSGEKKYNNDMKNSRNVKNKIATFEDFDHIDLRSRHTDQYDGTLQITSPFLIEQNEGSITYNSRKKYY